MKIHVLIVAMLLLPVSAGAQQLTQSTRSGQLAQCQEIGKFMGRVAQLRSQGVSMSTVVESMEKASGHVVDLNNPGDRGVLKYIAAIYANKTTPEQSQKIFTSGCIRGVTMSKLPQSSR